MAEDQQTPNRRCSFCGEGLTCPHGYCDECQECLQCVFAEYDGDDE
jgi:hypothetical protein